MKEDSNLLLIEKVLMLKELNIFSETPEPILASIAHLVKEDHFAAKEEIFNEGDLGNSMYVIFRGSVHIHKGNHLLETFKEKDFFGELSLLDTETRSATAIAATDCILFRIEQESFYDLVDSQPEVVKGILKILCRRLRKMNERLMLKEPETLTK
jgi:CRP/FNR family transcriptional regulator, cyclic AMP receptor protein